MIFKIVTGHQKARNYHNFRKKTYDRKSSIKFILLSKIHDIGVYLFIENWGSKMLFLRCVASDPVICMDST